jgi:heat shock protein HtpX
MPRLKVIETDALNAFAAGIRQGNYSVAVTRGLINGLSASELECVLAHELTHIRNKDTQMMVIAVIFAGIIAFIGDIVFRRLDFPFGYSPQPGRSQRRSERRSEGSAGVVVIIIIALAVVAISWGVSVLIRFAISRAREILADAGAVELTKNPDAMIAALRRIERQAAIADVPSRMHAFFIESPALNPQRGWLSTHPSVDERVAALVQFAGGVDLANAPLAVQRKGPWS